MRESKSILKATGSLEEMDAKGQNVQNFFTNMLWEDRNGATAWNDAQQVIPASNDATAVLLDEIL